MSATGSYQVHNISRNMEQETRRLEAQVALFWEKELKRYKEFGLRDGMRVAEFGCGPGYLMASLLRTFPTMHITGVELDSTLVEMAQSHLRDQGLGDRCRLVRRSIMESELPDDGIDFAITRLVLEHLPHPVAAVKEVRRVLKPGGKAVFVDNDFEMHLRTYPEIPQLRELYDAYCHARALEGGNPKMGRQLPMVLHQGGLIHIDFDIISAHSHIIGDELFFKSEGVGIPAKLVQDGYLASKTLGEIAYQWREMIQHKPHAICRQLSMAVGQKPQ